jgi:excisionase family DNA binding protein
VEQLVSVKEAATLMACSEAAIRKWMTQRLLPRVKVGRLTRLRVTDLEAFIRPSDIWNMTSLIPRGPKRSP